MGRIHESSFEFGTRYELTNTVLRFRLDVCFRSKTNINNDNNNNNNDVLFFCSFLR